MDEKPNLNSGTPWSPWDDQDIRNGLDHGQTIEGAANFLCRTQSEIRQRLADIADADALCDGAILKDKRLSATASAWKPIGTLAPRWR